VVLEEKRREIIKEWIDSGKIKNTEQLRKWVSSPIIVKTT